MSSAIRLQQEILVRCWCLWQQWWRQQHCWVSYLICYFFFPKTKIVLLTNLQNFFFIFGLKNLVLNNIFHNLFSLGYHSFYHLFFLFVQFSTELLILFIILFKKQNQNFYFRVLVFLLSLFIYIFSFYSCICAVFFFSLTNSELFIFFNKIFVGKMSTLENNFSN